MSTGPYREQDSVCAGPGPSAEWPWRLRLGRLVRAMGMPLAQFGGGPLDFGQAGHDLIEAVPLHKIGPAHERSVLGRSSVVVPEIEVAILDRLVQGIGRKQAVTAQAVHDGRRFPNQAVDRVDHPGGFRIELIDRRLRVALQAHLLHVDFAHPPVGPPLGDRREEIVGEPLRGVVRHVHPLQPAHVAGGAGRHGHIGGGELSRIGLEVEMTPSGR